MWVSRGAEGKTHGVPTKKKEKSMTTLRLDDLTVSDSGFVFDGATGLSFALNETGIIALSCLRNGLDDDGTVDVLAQRFQRPRDCIEPAFAAFRRQLERYFK